MFVKTTVASFALYTCNTIIKSTGQWLSELLAYSWRSKLTTLLQQQYCSKENVYWLFDKLDNPDQRIAQDTNIFCNALGSIAKVIAAAPFQVMYYTYWTYQITTGYVVLAVYAFFLISLMLESLIIRPIARLVFEQERKEGDFRFAHMRLRSFLTEITLYRAGAAERIHLDHALQPVLANQLRLVMWRWLLSACTTGLEYAGALLNYSCLGLVVFTGNLPADMDSGQRARWVSNASFATLTLIYSFTQMLDLASQFSTLAGVTFRVGQLLQELDRLEGQAETNNICTSAATAAVAKEEDQDEQATLLSITADGSHNSSRTQQQLASSSGRSVPRSSLQQPTGSPSQHAQMQSCSYEEPALSSGDSQLVSDSAALPDQLQLSQHDCDKQGRQLVAAVHDFSCQRPDGKLLFQNLSFEVHQGDMVLVTGASGCGKSTLVCALAQLWPLCQGQCQMPVQDQVMFLPQRPVAAPGNTLLEQLIYPAVMPEEGSALDLQHLALLLQQVGLTELLQRVQENWRLSQNWQGMLSPGELQRLSIARVLYHHPLLAVMDEPVSAVGTSAGIDMLKLLQHHSITTIVTGQADSPLTHNNVSETFFALVISL
ncbi:TPA: ATP-binding cassette sub- D member 4, variant 2 [Trebouxia sp. C0006]